MERYFVEVHVNEAVVPDDEGADLNGIEAAREEATGILLEVARSVARGTNGQSLSVAVTDHDKKPLLRVVMSISVEHCS